MKRAPLFIAGFALALLGAPACSAILGYDQGTLSPDAAATPQPDGTSPLSDAPVMSGDGLPPPNDGNLPPTDAPGPPGDGGTEAGTPDGGIRDAATLMEASVSCVGCPDGAVVIYTAPPEDGELRGIAVDGTNTYFAVAPASGGGTIAKCAKSGCTTPTPLAKDKAQGVDGPAGVAIDPAGTTLFWANDSTAIGSYHCTPSACTPVPGVGGTSLGVAVDTAIDIYFGNAMGVLSQCSRTSASCVQETSFQPNPIYGIAADDNNVYWGYASAQIQNIATATSGSTSSGKTLFTDPGVVYGMALSGGKLYWVSRMSPTSGVLRKCTPSACSGAQPVQGTLPLPWGLAIDGANNAYITVNTSTGNGIVKIPLP